MKLYAEQPDSFSDRDAMIALDVISTGALDVRCEAHAVTREPIQMWAA